MKCLVVSLFAIAVVASSVYALDLPDPACCTSTLDSTMRVLLVPDANGNPHAEFEVTIINFLNCDEPIVGAVVDVLIGGQVDGKVRLCDAATLHEITDENGVARFNISGGGCFKDQFAVQIRANGIEIRRYDAVVSPDYTGWDNDGIAGRSSLSMTPEDLAAFATAYQGGSGSASCHDYDNNGLTDPPDLAVFVSAYGGGGTYCDP